MATPPPIVDSGASTLLSASAAHDTVVALEAEAGPDRPWISGFALGLCAVALASLPVIPMDVTLRVVGQVRPKTETVEIRCPSTSQIEEVFVERGAEVAAGDALVRLANAPLRERYRRVHTEHERAGWERADWNCLIVHIRENRKDLPVLGHAWARQALAEFRARMEAQQLLEEQAHREIARLKPLLKRGLIPTKEYEEANDLASRASGAKRLVYEQALADWEKNREEALRTVDRLEAEKKQIEAELALLTLHSPAPGVLLDLTPLPPGTVVVAGQLLGRISVDDALQIEAALPSRAAALVEPGQEAQVAFSALPSLEWGMLRGVVDTVAADILPGAPFPVYRITLHPLADHLTHRDGRVARIRKGFGADVRLFLGTTTVFTHLRLKASDWIQSDGLSAKGGPRPFLQNLSRQPSSVVSSSGETGG